MCISLPVRLRRSGPSRSRGPRRRGRCRRRRRAGCWRRRRPPGSWGKGRCPRRSRPRRPATGRRRKISLASTGSTQADARDRGEAFGEAAGHGVGVAARGAATAVGQVGVELGRQEAHLAEQLAGPLAAEAKPRQFARAEDRRSLRRRARRSWWRRRTARRRRPSRSVRPASSRARTRALAKRAPSMWTGRPQLRATSPSAATSSGVDRAGLGRLGTRSPPRCGWWTSRADEAGQRRGAGRSAPCGRRAPAPVAWRRR